MSYKSIQSRAGDPNVGVVEDQAIVLTGSTGSKAYPDKLRRICYQDPDSNKKIVFLTNSFDLKASEVAQLYRHRWKIELFFKWIKQHLKIKAFWGYSENAVKTQVWIAICAYVLIAIAKKKFRMQQSLYEILQVVSISAFEKVPIDQLFHNTITPNPKEQNVKQLTIWKL